MTPKTGIRAWQSWATGCAVALGIAVLAVPIFTRGNGDDESAMVATLDKPAVAKVPMPPGAKPVFVDVRVSAYVPSRAGPVDALVTLSSSSSPEREVGRFSIFPADRFTARASSEERTFRLDASKALKATKVDGPVKVTVRLVPADPERPPADAKLTISNVQLTARR